MELNKGKVSFKNSVISMDQFGQTIGLTYKGHHFYRTLPGALCTFFLGFIFFFYVVSRFLYFATQVDPDIYIDVFNVDTSTVELLPAQKGF